MFTRRDASSLSMNQDTAWLLYRHRHNVVRYFPSGLDQLVKVSTILYPERHYNQQGEQSSRCEFARPSIKKYCWEKIRKGTLRFPVESNPTCFQRKWLIFRVGSRWQWFLNFTTRTKTLKRKISEAIPRDSDSVSSGLRCWKLHFQKAPQVIFWISCSWATPWRRTTV